MHNSQWYEFKASAARQETEVLLYAEIGSYGIGAAQFVSDLQKIPAANRLILRIHSPGGSVLDGNAICNAIKAHPGGATSQIDGLAASMAGVIAIAGKPVRMAANGLFMLHNVCGGAQGDAAEMQRVGALLSKVQETITDAYVQRTKLPRVKVAEMMDAETWLNATEAKKLGFIDEITPEQKMDAVLSRFASIRRRQYRSRAKGAFPTTSRRDSKLGAIQFDPRPHGRRICSTLFRPSTERPCKPATSKPSSIGSIAFSRAGFTASAFTTRFF